MEMSQIYDFTVIFNQTDEGGYNVSVPALPGCFTQGETLDEAKAMAEDAIRLYCHSLAADGEKIPQERGAFVGHIQVSALPA